MPATPLRYHDNYTLCFFLFFFRAFSFLQSAGVRRRSLEKARASTPGGAVVAVDDVKFDRFITGVPRQYEAVVFFTASGASYKCASCRCEKPSLLDVLSRFSGRRTREKTVLGQRCTGGCCCWGFGGEEGEGNDVVGGSLVGVRGASELLTAYNSGRKKCKDRWSANIKTNQSLHFRPQY